MPEHMMFEIHGMHELLLKLSHAKKMEPLKGLMTQAGLIAQRTARENAPRDTAALQRSLLLEVHPFSARVYTSLAYGPPTEYGRRAGAPMPPPDALLGWVRRHWGVQGAAARSAAFVLARAIGRRGIKGRFYMQKAKQAVEHALPRLLDVMVKQMEEKWGGR